MPSAVVEALLDVAPVFAHFDPQDRNDLLDISVEETYAAGLEIVSRGEVARSMFVLGEGTAEVLEPGDPDDQMLATLIPPCTFGDVAFFERSEHVVTVRTLTAVRVLSIERAGFDRLLARQSLAAYKLALNVLLKLGDQMRRVDAWVASELSHADSSRREQWAEFRAKLHQGWEI